MNIRNLTLVLGAAFTVAASGVAATACSSSNTPTPITTKDSGTGSSSGGSSGGSSSGSGSSSGGSNDAGTGAECGSIPTLHTAEAGSIYCDYNGDGGALNCGVGTQCCLGGEVNGAYSPQICAQWGDLNACTNGSDASTSGNYAALPVECYQVSDCVANGMTGATACCLTGGANGPTEVAGCDYLKATSGKAIVCEGDGGGAATACAGGEIQVCTQDADCPTGKTCQPGKWKIVQLGFCQ